MSDTPNPLPDYHDTARWLSELGAINSPAELHGLLCGRFCGGGRYQAKEWLAAAQEFLDLPDAIGPEAARHIHGLYQTTLAQFDSDEMAVEILLPDDAVAMNQRLDALGQWCHGFLAGFGGSGIAGNTQLPGETADILRDFAAFTQIDPEEIDESNSETDYMEIVEYLRVATLTVFMELGQPDVLAEPSTVH